MRRSIVPKEIREEEERIMDLIMSSDEDMTLKEYIEKFASQEYKEYLERERKRDAELWKRGIIAN